MSDATYHLLDRIHKIEARLNSVAPGEGGVSREEFDALANAVSNLIPMLGTVVSAMNRQLLFDQEELTKIYTHGHIFWNCLEQTGGPNPFIKPPDPLEPGKTSDP